METFIFAVGVIVCLMVVFGIFSLVPGEMRPSEKVIYREGGQDIGSLK
ncbi:hypothetical protein BH10ACI1_BH10ACI1_12700 [soil metagenome]